MHQNKDCAANNLFVDAEAVIRNGTYYDVSAPEDLERLINSGLDVNYVKEGCTPLLLGAVLWAEHSRRYDFADLLLKAGANVDDWLRHEGQSDRVVLFQESMYQQAMELIWMSKDGDVANPVKDLERLIYSGLDVNFVRGADEDRDDPLLFHAVRAHQYDLVGALIGAGADVNALVRYAGETGLFKAIENKDVRMIELLVRAGANIDARDNYGDTPRKLLEAANMMGVVECVLADQEREAIEAALVVEGVVYQGQRISRRM